jgi:hypothetical protein
VPGTREAKDAVLLASIPTTTTVDIDKKTVVNVVYSGQPQFIPIQGTSRFQSGTSSGSGRSQGGSGRRR